MAQTTAIFVGIKGTVLALDRGTGQEIWRTPLTGGDFVNVVLDDSLVYAATKGEIFCIDPANGQLCWHNELKGLGRDLVTIAPSGDGQAAVIREKRRRDEAAAAAGTGAA